MNYLEVKPHPALADFVKCYWFLEKDYAVLDEPVETILPDGCIDLIFQSGGFYSNTPSAGFLIGQLKHPLALSAAGMTRTLGIRFYAYGAYPFLRTPLKLLVDQLTDLAPLLGSAARELAGQAADLPALEAFAAFERFLLRRLPDTTLDLQQIRAAAERVFQQQGAVDVHRLADYTDLSLRSLERKFAEIVGCSPKTLARIVRFDRLKNELMFNPAINLTDLTYRYHYFDQAHFIRDFEQFTGHSPSAFAKKVADYQIYFYK